MNRQKINSIFLRALLALGLILLSGCQEKEEIPFYQMEKHEDFSEVLYIEGVQYSRDWNKGDDEQVYYFNYNDNYVWTPGEGIGKQIGVCGKDVDKDASLKIYEIAGDEERAFLYTWPARFYSGGVEGRLWRQEGVTLNAPTAENVSVVTIVSHEEENTLVKVDDPAMIAGLLEIYNDENIQTATKEDFENSENWMFASLIMHHKEYPFLQYRTGCRYAPEQNILYCEKGKDRKWFAMPQEWVEAISKQ